MISCAVKTGLCCCCPLALFVCPSFTGSLLSSPDCLTNLSEHEVLQACNSREGIKWVIRIHRVGDLNVSTECCDVIAGVLWRERENKVIRSQGTQTQLTYKGGSVHFYAVFKGG